MHVVVTKKQKQKLQPFKIQVIVFRSLQTVNILWKGLKYILEFQVCEDKELSVTLVQHIHFIKEMGFLQLEKRWGTALKSVE